MILEFYGEECPHCDYMKPIVERLRKEGLEVESLEVWHNDNNAHRMDTYDQGKCGGVPFYLNPKTEKWICGATSYEELKTLAE